MLLLVNGPPGVGKSTVARHYVDEHPRSLLVEVDDLRTSLGGWRSDETSRDLARELTADLVVGHLARGYDVVVPQYLGRAEFAEQLCALAATAGTPFVEVVLDAPVDLVRDRFRRRRHELERDHPEADVPDELVDAAIDEAVWHLGRRTGAWLRIVVDASGDAVSTYDALIRALPSG